MHDAPDIDAWCIIRIIPKQSSRGMGQQMVEADELAAVSLCREAAEKFESSLIKDRQTQPACP